MRAVVLGASMGGLAIARALSRHVDHVTLVERDDLPVDAATRKGVPQGEHAHGLLSSGYRVLDEYFPGLMEELAQAGAAQVDVTGDFLWYQYGAWKLRADSGLRGIMVSRPCLEAAVRRRVRALPNVTVLERHSCETPNFDRARGRVTGVTLANLDTGDLRVIDADWVIDATGRGSQSPAWLESWGFGAVQEQTVQVDMGYATAQFERRPGDFHGAMGGIIAGTSPQSTRSCGVLSAEGNRWIITMIGVLKDYPPTDLAGWKAFARSLPVPEPFELVDGRAPLGPIASYRFPANRRRLYSRLPRFPAGYLVAADAICSFNPIYGQGMSVALLTARALDDCLAQGFDRLTERFLQRAAATADSPWAIATGEDLRYPSVAGPRPFGFSWLSRYLELAHAAASRDRVVLRRFFEVASLVRAPTALLSPHIAWRIFLGGRGSATTGPAHKQLVAGPV